MSTSRRRTANACLFVVMLIGASLPLAAGTPASSKERGARVSDLRSTIDSAEAARRDGESARAESLYLEVAAAR